jgi:hypothetical protein
VSGKYLVTLTGIRCYQASMDDLLSRDGVGDEVYASTYIRRYDRGTGELVETATRQSASHGDVQNFGNQRLQAGTRSQTGGIHDGDMIPGPALLAMRSVQPQSVTFPANGCRISRPSIFRCSRSRACRIRSRRKHSAR